jgi:hypothetical protein
MPGLLSATRVFRFVRRSIVKSPPLFTSARWPSCDSLIVQYRSG